MENKNYAKGRNDLFSGIVLCLFAAAYVYGATQIKIMKMLASTFLNASSVPKLWGVLMFTLGVVLIIRGVVAMNKEKAGGYAPENISFAQRIKQFWRNNRAAVLMFVVLALYTVLMEPIGFLITTVLFLWAEFNILSRKEERKLILTSILAVVFGVGIYVLFHYAFSMPLPQGILKGIF